MILDHDCSYAWNTSRILEKKPEQKFRPKHDWTHDLCDTDTTNWQFVIFFS